MKCGGVAQTVLPWPLLCGSRGPPGPQAWAGCPSALRGDGPASSRSVKVQCLHVFVDEKSVTESAAPPGGEEGPQDSGFLRQVVGGPPGPAGGRALCVWLEVIRPADLEFELDGTCELMEGSPMALGLLSSPCSSRLSQKCHKISM